MSNDHMKTESSVKSMFKDSMGFLSLMRSEWKIVQ